MNAHLLVALLLIFTVNQVSGFRSIRPSFLGRITPGTCLNVVSDIEIVAREFTLTDNLRQKVEEKIGKALEKLGQDATTARVVLRVHKAQMQGKNTTLVSANSHFPLKPL